MEVEIMLFDMAKNVENSDFASEEYIVMNNCGKYQNCPKGMKIIRNNGRSDYQAVYIEKGEMLFNGKKVSAGTVFIYKPQERQEYSVCSENATFYWVHFTGKAANELFTDSTNQIIKTGMFEAFVKFCVKAIDLCRINTEISRITISGELLCLLADIQQRSKLRNKIKNPAEAAVIYINEHSIKRCSNDEYAKMCGISKFYFIKQFVDITGQPPQKYRINILISKGKAMLTDTNLRICEIAEALGFEDALYFSRIFKKNTGVSPQYYRKNY